MSTRTKAAISCFLSKNTAFSRKIGHLNGFTAVQMSDFSIFRAKNDVPFVCTLRRVSTPKKARAEGFEPSPTLDDAFLAGSQPGNLTSAERYQDRTAAVFTHRRCKGISRWSLCTDESRLRCSQRSCYQKGYALGWHLRCAFDSRYCSQLYQIGYRTVTTESAWMYIPGAFLHYRDYRAQHVE